MTQQTADSTSAQSAAHEERLIRESGMDARVAALIEPVLGVAGFRLVRVRSSAQQGMTLQIMAERQDGTMTIEDCEEVSRLVSPLLDVEDVVAQAYHLEVSSPGIDRPLVRKSDFARWTGQIVKLETSVVVADRKRFKGRIASVNAAGIVLEREQMGYGEQPEVSIPWETIGDARLVLTDDLIRDALREDKKLRDAAKKARKAGDDEEAGDGE